VNVDMASTGAAAVSMRGGRGCACFEGVDDALKNSRSELRLFRQAAVCCDARMAWVPLHTPQMKAPSGAKQVPARSSRPLSRSFEAEQRLVIVHAEIVAETGQLTIVRNAYFAASSVIVFPIVRKRVLGAEWWRVRPALCGYGLQGQFVTERGKDFLTLASVRHRQALAPRVSLHVAAVRSASRKQLPWLPPPGKCSPNSSLFIGEVGQIRRRSRGRRPRHRKAGQSGWRDMAQRHGDRRSGAAGCAAFHRRAVISNRFVDHILDCARCGRAAAAREMGMSAMTLAGLEENSRPDRTSKPILDVMGDQRMP